MVVCCFEQMAYFNITEQEEWHGRPPYGDLILIGCSNPSGARIPNGTYRPVTPEYLGFMIYSNLAMRKRGPTFEGWDRVMEAADELVLALIDETGINPSLPPHGYRRPKHLNPSEN
jgi:hypothetical protein